MGKRFRIYYYFIVLTVMFYSFGTGGVQVAAGAETCSFNVVSSPGGGGDPLSNAVTIGGSPADELNISGNVSVSGGCGNVHTNGDVDFDGASADVTSITANGTIQDCPAGTTCTQVPDPVVTPTINAQDFEDYVDYKFLVDGRVLERTGGSGPYTYTEIGNCNAKTGECTSGKWWGWDFKASQQQWSLPGCDTTSADPASGCMNGSFYVEGSIQVTSNPGTLTDPWEISFIVTGSIDFAGNGNVQLNPNNHDNIGNILFLANLDIEYSGNPTQYTPGVIAAGEQINISGNPLLNGCIFTNGNPSTSGAGRTVTDDKISGNPDIICDSNCKWPEMEEQVTITEPF